MQVNLDGAVAVLSHAAGQWVTVTMITIPKMRKKLEGKNNPFQQGVECRATRQFMFAVNYGNAVNLQRVREDKVTDFIPESLWNGKGRWFDKVTVEHIETKRRYFGVKPRQVGEDGKVVSIKKEWFDVATGEQIDVVDVLPWLLSSGTSNRQELDRKVEWRTPAVESVKTFTVGGITYFLTV